jgi:hypothetical protein
MEVGLATMSRKKQQKVVKTSGGNSYPINNAVQCKCSYSVGTGVE